ncbi:MAG: hypothetical protein AAFR16_15025, partial [Pseudomonadota bacterium]
MKNDLVRRAAAAALAVGLASLAGAAGAQTPLASAGPIAFGPDDVLFVGDALGGRIVALDLSGRVSDQSGFALGRAETFEGRTIVADLRAELGRRMAAPAAQILVNDVAVHRGAGQIFLSGHRGLGPDATPFIAAVDQGEVAILDLSALPSTSHALAAPVAFSCAAPAQSRRRRRRRCTRHRHHHRIEAWPTRHEPVLRTPPASRRPATATAR